MRQAWQSQVSGIPRMEVGSPSLEAPCTLPLSTGSEGSAVSLALYPWPLTVPF